MQNFHEEEVLGKAYDSRLMKRLLVYARPFWPLILLSITLLLIITLVDLALPYLVKVAIDDHINAFDRPLVVFQKGEEPVEGFLYQGEVLIREDYLEEEYPLHERYQVIYQQGQYYLVSTLLNPSGQRVTYEKIEREGITYVVDEEGDYHQAYLLESSDLQRLRSRDLASVIRIGLIYLLMVTGAFGLHYLQIFILQLTGQRIIYNIREEIFSHLQGLSLSFFDKNPVGRLVTRVTNDTETLNEMYTGVLVNLFKDIFLLVGIVIVMMRMNLQLALISFSVIPILIISTVLFRLKIRDAYRQVRVMLARINASLQENLAGMRIVQIFSRQREEYLQFKEINNEHLEANLREIKILAVFRPFTEFLNSLALALLLWYGGGRLLMGTLEFGVLYAFINYIQQFFRPINDLTEKYNILQSAMASSERIFQILDTEERIENPPHPIEMRSIKGEIQFKDVSFYYQKGEWVLQDINLKVRPGETVALVGATGSGKTSITRLLSRFYDIQKGEILIDGVDIRKIEKGALRRAMGVVLQDVFLFTGTIESNIRLYNSSIDDETIKKVAEEVHLAPFIQSLPEGYQERVTERGSTFSAGERQLLAFARALAFDPKILVLDEATASIDTETEILIQKALERLVKGRTTMIVAHRLSTIQNAHTIVVLHKGRIREIGDHQELLAKKGIYYDLYQLQYQKKEKLSHHPA